MDQSEKSELIKSIMPDLVELLSVAIDKMAIPENTEKAKKIIKTVKKLDKPKEETIKRNGRQNKQKLKTSIKTEKLSKPVKSKPPRSDFDHKKPGFVDNLTLETELIEIDKKICKRTGYKADRPKITKSKCECGKMFEGSGYLCDKCILGRKPSAQ